MIRKTFMMAAALAAAGWAQSEAATAAWLKAGPGMRPQTPQRRLADQGSLHEIGHDVVHFHTPAFLKAIGLTAEEWAAEWSPRDAAKREIRRDYFDGLTAPVTVGTGRVETAIWQ